MEMEFEAGDLVYEWEGKNTLLVVSRSPKEERTGHYLDDRCDVVCIESLDSRYHLEPGEDDRTESERFTFLRTPTDEERVQIKLTFGV